MQALFTEMHSHPIVSEYKKKKRIKLLLQLYKYLVVYTPLIWK